MAKTKDTTKKVCRYHHTEVYQGEKARICKQRVTGSYVKTKEVVIFCPHCNKELNEKTEVITKRRHKGMPRGEWIFDDYYCSKCNESMTKNDYEYSLDEFGKALCHSCIKKEHELKI